jgi:hypothetical protein
VTFDKKTGKPVEAEVKEKENDYVRYKVLIELDDICGGGREWRVFPSY